MSARSSSVILRAARDRLREQQVAESEALNALMKAEARLEALNERRATVIAEQDRIVAEQQVVVDRSLAVLVELRGPALTSDILDRPSTRRSRRVRTDDNAQKAHRNSGKTTPATAAPTATPTTT